MSVLGEQFCVPLIWKLLPKRGNSSQQERIDLISELLLIPGLPDIKVMIGDREFVGATWFKYLKDNKSKMENLIVASFEKDTKVSKEYSDRWYIEVMFKNFKSNGFDMESTHVTDLESLRNCFDYLHWVISVQ
ncbi:MAG: hypothetical protein IPM26_13725 [Saprospiraceae bacterium]|nr:hypothetical protein [Saprospiraceae bacterium]